MLKRWLRILEHRWRDRRHALRVLGRGAPARLAARVRASEARHSGEICLCVEAGLPLSYLWRDASARTRAIALFGKLRVWDTAQNNGVLIYLLLAERRIEIVADRGLNERVEAACWQAIAQAMGSAFKSGAFEPGLEAAIDAVSALLEAHFPLAPGQANPNELPDRVVVRG